MKHAQIISLVLLLLVGTGMYSQKQPNVIIVYADDLGFGDLSAYGATELTTPNMDILANEGVQFMNGYTTSATCTPSRYGLLTGVYPWRDKEAKILDGAAPLIIGTDQMTIPKMMRSQGYQTAVIGKWHLGLGSGVVDWNDEIKPCPNQVGFDYSYIMAATQDRVPTVFIKDGRVDNLDPKDKLYVDYKKNFEGEPTGTQNPELLKLKWHHGHNKSIMNGISRIGYQTGGKSAYWVDEDMNDVFLTEVKHYIGDHKDKPFFLYYGLQQPHVPRTPHARFVGASGLGPRGDVILEADWTVGELLKTLEAEGILENTLIIFSSDNGPVLNDGYYDNAVEMLGNHTPWGSFRGGKYSLYEAGTHVPFMAYWKGTIKPSISQAMISQLDIFASLAELVGSKQKVRDSEPMLEVLLGKSDKGRKDYVVEATSRTAYKKGDWVMIPPYKGAAVNKKVNIELGNSAKYQLYNLKTDVAQQNNLATTEPEKLQEMISGFIKIRGENYNNTKQLILK